MRKIALILAVILTGLISFGQKEKVYTSLEEAQRNPSQVFILALNNKKLTEVPEAITQFTNLSVLDLAGNRLNSIPESIL